LDLCLCALVPRLETRTKLVLLLHVAEAKRPTNTGRLATLALTNSELHLRGLMHQSADIVHAPERRTVVLYPDDDAAVLSREWLDERPVTLIVPDGSWRQAAKMPRREPALVDLPRVKLPPIFSPKTALRREPKAEGMATLAAIAYAFGILEGAEVEAALLALLAEAVARTLQGRGIAPIPTKL
jgi:DTW domain-containing protein YfiP